jgi:hypothetical protein
MSLSFARAEIRLFDLHLCLPPLLDPTLFTPDFAFLADRVAYMERFLTLPELDRPHLVVRSLRRELRRSRFWDRYGSILVPELAAAESQVWDLQVPLRVRPKGLDLFYSPDPSARLGASAFLFPGGWSSQLVLSLPGPHTLDSLRAKVSDLLHGEPFRLASAPRRLSQIFAELAGRLREDMHGGRVRTTPALARHVVIELLSRGEVPTLVPSGAGSMSDADRARLHGALLGTVIGIPELIARERAHSFLCTPFSNGDFALTYFEHGTLLSLSNTVLHGKNATSAECLAGNILACTLMAQFLATFLKAAQDFAASDIRIAALCRAAGSALRQLPKVYDNDFCHGLFENHGTLTTLRQRLDKGTS